MSKVLFKTGTKAQFATITPDDGTLYFLSDTKEVYKGAVRYSRESDFMGIINASSTETWMEEAYTKGAYAYVSEKCTKTIGGASFTFEPGDVVLATKDRAGATLAIGDFVILHHGSAGTLQPLTINIDGGTAGGGSTVVYDGSTAATVALNSAAEWETIA